MGVYMMTEYRIVTPDEWGFTWKRTPTPEKLLDPEEYIHHSGGAAWESSDVLQVFRNLNRYAQQNKNYAAVDYDIMVGLDRVNDVVYIGGARQEWLSAATRDRNEQGEAICLLGNTDVREPDPRELEGLARAIVHSRSKGWSAPNALTLGHRDNLSHPGATACPGRFLQAQLPLIRRRVAELLTYSEDIVYVTFTAPGSAYAPGVAPLYQIIGNTIRWISPDVHAKLGAPAPSRAIGADEAKRLVLIGPSPDGARHFAGQVA